MDSTKKSKEEIINKIKNLPKYDLTRELQYGYDDSEGGYGSWYTNEIGKSKDGRYFKIKDVLYILENHND